ncbi:MAG: methionine adenosyltransferase domain-containing protein [Candidatus Parcubacteria bacterium]|nr:methionine adenosyltransferase domain-containing protein [Candidatus Parcubacteria bacterium]
MAQIYTAECVSPKHPDKICDQLADVVLDICLKQDKKSRVALEVMGGHRQIVFMGEITSQAQIDYKTVVKSLLGVEAKRYTIIENVVRQSPEISRSVDKGGAGDQGIMIGYACDENKAHIPQEYYLARSLCQFIYKRNPTDGKTQITLKDNKIISLVASFQNIKKVNLEKLIQQFLKDNSLKAENLYINQAGDWDRGGFEADTGLTGRKIVIDSYGPRVPVGGGAFSGKDPSKVDRSGAYMARKIALDYLKKYKAHEVMVRLAYVIGYNQPLMVQAICDGKITNVEGYDLRPRAIIKRFNLLKPIYKEVAAWGSFGHNFAWER